VLNGCEMVLKSAEDVSGAECVGAGGDGSVEGDVD
jgi:hypothetical protein